MTSRPAPTAVVASLATVDAASCSAAEVAAAVKKVRRARGWLDAVESQLAARANELAEAGSGAPAAEPFSNGGGKSSREARRADRRSNTLKNAPSLGDALGRGDITAEHADALSNAASRLKDDERDELFGRHAQLADKASGMAPEEFGRHCRREADRISRDNGAGRADRQRRNTTLRKSIDPVTGMYRFSGELHPELGSRVFTAIDAEVAAMVAASGDRSVDRNHLAAKALATLVSGGHAAERPGKAELTVIIDIESLRGNLAHAGVCEMGDGTDISAATARRLACEADLLPVVLGGDSVPLDVGRSRRLASEAQRRALRSIYRTCGFDNCDVAFGRCEIHHLADWFTEGGPTDLANLLPICSRHHHLVHEGGWHLELAADRTLTIRERSGEQFAVCRPDGLPPDDEPPPGHRRPHDQDPLFAVAA